MINFSNSTIEKVSVHNVGNKTNEEDLILSNELLDISDNLVKALLSKFFLTPFSNVEFNAFTFSNGDFTMNPLYNFASNIFDNEKTLHKNAIDIAKYLYEVSTHPQIKSGDLFVAYFKDIEIAEAMTDAIGIFKSENRQSFLKVDNEDANFRIQYDDGINIDKLDKGCLILNVNKAEGYKVCIVNKANKNTEAQYWREDFLKLKPLNDEYHFTKDMMGITKDFVTKQLTEEFVVSKADQIDFLNRSVDYFKTHETFNQKEFEAQIFIDKDVRKSFQDFDASYRATNNLELDDHFDISMQAVKKQVRVFKTVLKLDRNFHIYIHGDRDLIEQGTDADGRKFYKLYFDKEA
jgi:37-kD nucleoid-associated bacterial protein